MRIPALLLLSVLLIGVVSAYDSMTFQNYEDIADPAWSGSISWDHAVDGTNSRATTNGNLNYTGSVFDYAAATMWSGNLGVYLYNTSGSMVGGISGIGFSGKRVEAIVSGGVLRFYVNGVKTGSDYASPTNPVVIRFSGTPTYIDDFIIGSGSQYIFGSPETGTTIVNDMVNPAASGLFNLSGYIGSATNMTTSYGYGDTNLSHTVSLLNYDTHAVYATNISINGTKAGTVTWPLSTIIGVAPYGLYSTTIEGSGTYGEPFLYKSSGASIAFDVDAYAPGDTATVTYSITPAYWNSSSYDYKVGIRDAYGTYVKNSTVSSTSGTATYTFSTNDAEGVYYAIMFAVPKTSGSEIWMNLDYADLTQYTTFYGYVLNAENTSVVSNAAVSARQSSIWSNYTSGPDGNYTVTGFFSGSPIGINTTKTGYNSDWINSTPLAGGTHYVNITLVPSTPKIANATIGGVFRDTSYMAPIAGATIEMVNGSESFAPVTNLAGYYTYNVTADTLYNITGVKVGYLNSTAYQKRVAAGAFAQQDGYMDAAYTITVRALDSSNSPIPVVTIIDSIGQNVTTTDGTAQFSESFGLVYFYLSSSGYASRSTSTVADSNKTISVNMYTAAAPSTRSTWWTPHQVQLTLYDTLTNNRLVGVNVTAKYNSTTVPDGWLTSMYGMEDAAAADMVNSTILMHGYSGGDGSITFTMLGSIGYDIYLTSAAHGINNKMFTVFPTGDSLNLYAVTTGGSIPTSKNSTYSATNGTKVYVVEPNMSYVSMCIDYVDSSGLTNYVNESWVYQNNLTVMHTEDFVPGTSLVTKCHTVQNVRGTQMWWGFNASRRD